MFHARKLLSRSQSNLFLAPPKIPTVRLRLIISHEIINNPRETLKMYFYSKFSFYFLLHSHTTFIDKCATAGSAEESFDFELLTARKYAVMTGRRWGMFDGEQ